MSRLKSMFELLDNPALSLDDSLLSYVVRRGAIDLIRIVTGTIIIAEVLGLNPKRLTRQRAVYVEYQMGLMYLSHLNSYINAGEINAVLEAYHINPKQPLREICRQFFKATGNSTVKFSLSIDEINAYLPAGVVLLAKPRKNKKLWSAKQKFASHFLHDDLEAMCARSQLDILLYLKQHPVHQLQFNIPDFERFMKAALRYFELSEDSLETESLYFFKYLTELTGTSTLITTTTIN